MQHRTSRRWTWLLAAAATVVGGLAFHPACDDNDHNPFWNPEDDTAECSNDADDDGDGWADCLDDGCASLAICRGGDGDADGDGDVEDETDDGGDPCAAYPCEPYGTGLSAVLADLGFVAANPAALDLAGGDGRVDFRDLYARSQDPGDPLVALHLFVTAGWCEECTAEAAALEGLYAEYAPEGVEFLGLVLEGDAEGTPASAAYALAYANRHGWSFPAVVGTLDEAYWPPAGTGPAPGSLPLHLLVDLRAMKLYGRYAGGGRLKVLEETLFELATTPRWGPDGRRQFDFRCGDPTGGSETEPNGWGDRPEDGTSLPLILNGTSCYPVIADGISVDIDVIDLGDLAAGRSIEVGLSRDGVNGFYPFFRLLRQGTMGMAWASEGPTWMDRAEARRQWIIDTPGRYYVAVVDGRTVAEDFHGADGTIPEPDLCCEGGLDYDYAIGIDNVELRANREAHAEGTSDANPMTDGNLQIHPFDAEAGIPYVFRMSPTDPDLLDPQLTLWDPAAGSVLAANDDAPDASAGEAEIRWTAPDAMQVWVVAGYRRAYFREGIPAYDLAIVRE